MIGHLHTGEEMNWVGVSDHIWELTADLPSPIARMVRFLVLFTETLLSSPDSRDWVKISEMFLGPAPEAWSFLPKHKSNAYDSQG